MKPLFIPLKTKYFRAFEDGSKRTEYRLHGRGWIAKNCPKGRKVILSHGYSGARLYGVVRSFQVRVMDTEIYGKGKEIACIGIDLI